MLSDRIADGPSQWRRIRSPTSAFTSRALATRSALLRNRRPWAVAHASIDQSSSESADMRRETLPGPVESQTDARPSCRWWRIPHAQLDQHCCIIEDLAVVEKKNERNKERGSAGPCRSVDGCAAKIDDDDVFVYPPLHLHHACS